MQNPAPPRVGRLTRHRAAVLATITAHPAHLSAAEVYDQVRASDPGIAYATVYNALHYLVAVGLIAEVRRPDGVVSYDRETAPHDHVLCQQCGALGDVPRTPTAGASERGYAAVAAQTGFTVDAHRVEYSGVCPACQAAGRVRRPAGTARAAAEAASHFSTSRSGI